MELFINQVGTDNQLRSSSPKWRQGSSDDSRTEKIRDDLGGSLNRGPGISW